MLLQLRGIEKRFGGVTALRRGDLNLAAGEVHLLMGENGAGKSTLMKIVAGLYDRDGGEMLWQGHPVRFRSPAEAAQGGVAMVHQESLLAPHLSVAENMFLGREERHALGWVNRKRMAERAARVIEEHHFPLQADWVVGKLSPAGKQLVEICRAVSQGASLLIFDEPTSSLSEGETHEVFRLVRALRDRNLGVIYITHRLQELRSVGDSVTVLRDGETVHTGPLSDLSPERLIQYMVGRKVDAHFRRETIPLGEEMLSVDSLTRKPVLDNISFRVRAGEIVGIAGLMGAGRTELCRALFGIDGIDSGVVRIAGRELRARSPREAVDAGMALIPEDRQRTGLATDLSIAVNMTLADVPAVSPFGFLDRKRERSATEQMITRLRIKADSPAQRARSLSGGNQQKIVIGKWLLRGAQVFLFDEPTRGIDVGAKSEVFDVMDSLARNGAAILMISSELPELLQIADRILVMREGALTQELDARATTQEEIMRYAAPAGSTLLEEGAR